MPLGRTGLDVSRLGFGTYDLGVPAHDISPEAGGQILAEAHRLGVTLWDTSDDYGSHPHVAAALTQVPREEVLVSTKTGARTGKGARKSLAASLKELGTDYVDLFLLHYVTSGWLSRSRTVLRELAEEKVSGRARAIGLSTHSVSVVREAATWDEVDVVLAVCCGASPSTIRRHREAIPLEDGSMGAMLEALRSAHREGKGIIGMKVLGTGLPSLVKNYRSSIRAVVKLGFVDAFLVGMKSLGELRKNVSVFTS